jgi:transcriptional regulator with XRE-family HTH domain
MTKEEKIYLIALGEAIFTKRKVLHITQEELAEKVGLTRNHIHRIETGQIATSVIILRRIAKELGLESFDIMKGI